MTQPFTFAIRVRANSSINKVGGTAGDAPRLVVAVQAPAVEENVTLLSYAVSMNISWSLLTRDVAS